MTHVKFNNRSLDRSFNSVFNELFNGFPVLTNEGVSSLSKMSSVPANIKETAESYLLELVAPGFEKSDFKVNLDDNILTISVEKKNEVKNETGKHIRREYSYQGFKRSFTIDDKIDATGIEASYVNGVLVLNLPKKPEVKQTSKDIQIK